MSAILIHDTSLAATALAEGKLVALPTETVYGLGANALDTRAVSGIFAAKNRPSFDPLIIHQSSQERIFRYVSEVPPAAHRLAESCWPGPLTLVLPKAAMVPDLVTSGLPTVAVRVPAHSLTREVLRQVEFPVAAPSANPFGFVSPTTAAHVADQLGERIDFILDGGPCTVGLESTIVGFAGGMPTVLRKGGLPVEAISEILGHSIAVRTHGSSKPEAPGMLSKHYSPGVEMILMEKSEGFYPITPADAVIGFGFPGVAYPEIGYDRYELSAARDLGEAAANLFHTLRIIASRNYRRVYVTGSIPEEGLGSAINDRLRRAAAN